MSNFRVYTKKAVLKALDNMSDSDTIKIFDNENNLIGEANKKDCLIKGEELFVTFNLKELNNFCSINNGIAVDLRLGKFCCEEKED